MLNNFGSFQDDAQVLWYPLLCIFQWKFINHHSKTQKEKANVLQVGRWHCFGGGQCRHICGTQRGWRFDKQLGCQQPCIVFLTPRRIASTLAHQCWLCLSRHRSPITCFLLHPSRTFLRLCDIPSPCGCQEHVPNPTLPHKGHCGLKNNMSKINNANESIFCTMKTCTLQYKFFWGSN